MDLSEFEEASKRKRPPCVIGKLRLSEEQRAKLNAALVKFDISTAAIVRVLREWGFETNEMAVRRHRKNECGCG